MHWHMRVGDILAGDIILGLSEGSRTYRKTYLVTEYRPEDNFIYTWRIERRENVIISSFSNNTEFRLLGQIDPDMLKYSLNNGILNIQGMAGLDVIKELGLGEYLPPSVMLLYGDDHKTGLSNHSKSAGFDTFSTVKRDPKLEKLFDAFPVDLCVCSPNFDHVFRGLEYAREFEKRYLNMEIMGAAKTVDDIVREAWAPFTVMEYSQMNLGYWRQIYNRILEKHPKMMRD